MGAEQHVDRPTGTVLTATVYNDDHKRHVDNQPVVDTKSILEARTVPASIDLLLLAGYAAAGDGGGAQYKRVGSEPQHPGKIQSADGAWWEIASSNLDIAMFGATGTGDETTKVSNWLDTAEALGLVAFASRPNTYLVNEIRLTTTKPLTIIMHSGAVIKGASGFATPVIEIDGDTDRKPVIWRGGEIDSSLRTHTVGASSGTGLTLLNSDDFSVKGVHFLAGADYRDDVGDTGLGLEQCGSGRVAGCHFRGHPDAGIYITGGPNADASDDHGDIVVEGCFFYGNALAITAKRQSRRLLVNGNFFERNLQGVGLFEASGLAPGKEFVVTDNIFFKAINRSINGRLSVGDIIANNTIVDFGYDLDDVVFGSDARLAILLDGVTGSRISGNVIRMDEWASTSTHTGIRVTEHLFDAVTTQSTKNTISFNTFDNLGAGIEERNSSTDNDLRGNTMIGVTTPITLAVGSSSIYEYYEPGVGVTTNENESGSFTPAFTFVTPGDLSVAYAAQTGNFKVIDDICFVDIILTFTPTYTTGTGSVVITGLPKTSAGRQQTLTLQQIENMDWAATDKQIGVQVLASDTEFRFVAMRDAATTVPLTESRFPSGVEYTIVVSGFYRIA